MKTSFSEYYRPTETEFQELWRQCIFTFDTNVLLNLYNYSSPAANTFLAVMKAFRQRVWLSHQVGKEYHRNRIGTLVKVAKEYNSVEKSINDLSARLHARTLPPFLEDDILAQADKLFEALTESTRQAKQRLLTNRNDDPIRDALTDLFDGKVGDGFDPTQLATIYKEGQHRYTERIPPGFMDEKDKPGNDKYGDLVIWKEIIEKAKSDSTCIILVTDDSKSDWWWILDKERIGPRPELLKEFTSETKQRMYLYSSDSFLTLADEFLAEHIDVSAIQEITGIQERDRLLTFEKGYEDFSHLEPPEATAIKDRLESLDDQSDEYWEVVRQYDEVVNRASSARFSHEFAARLSPDVQAQRKLLSESIAELLKKCRQCQTWDDRSEYKLPQWLEYVPESMVRYTSLPQLRQIEENMREYLKRHEQIEKSP